ncbi:MAG: 5'-3' exonuclease H3TH domain-containing protein [Chloroflexota bacterium]|nr:5'-3' exonuclease H3TH domain-containing protein [Chloroflexota bacterium]
MKIHLVDGTYELFRAYYAQPKRYAPNGQEVGAILGLMRTLIVLLRQADVSHVACAFDSNIESFRNTLFSGYKTGDGVADDLRSQFTLAERITSALGIVVWPMTEFEADDALASAVVKWSSASQIEQIVICSPDKDLAQMVTGRYVVCWDRRRELILDELGVEEKFGVLPVSIPDYLALVGDAADGIPGIPKWGAKSSGIILHRYQHLENIPGDASLWDVNVRSARVLSNNLLEFHEQVFLYRELATLRLDVPIEHSLEQMSWKGFLIDELTSACDEFGFRTPDALVK